ncbi:Putative cell survival pathways protein [Malassezia cuniculi]|uniref:Cell survival pathways protein n=1 Tax=Malassezia cuniculi TaxID=948313 RepID=A0AAF0J570_9BASI|nr:Putative cell survival pathways protein [Malassezia cuniculi]
MSGWGSWFTGSEQPNAQGAASGTNFRAVTDEFDQGSLYGPLEPADLEWTCPTYISTETQTWYAVIEDGSFVTCQIIYSPIGIWNPQVQMTFKYSNPKTGKKVWKSVNVSKFKLQDDKRSCQSEIFTVTLKDAADGSQEFDINAKLDDEVQILISFVRPKEALGWKLGNGATGGMSFFGKQGDANAPVVKHRFWPYAKTKGLVVIGGQAIDCTGQGCFVQALQGMRPNLVAARWNFAWFQSPELDGTSALLMELTTTSDYGKVEASGKREPQVVTFGSVTCQGKLVSVVGATRSALQPDDSPSLHSGTRVMHLEKVLDPETGYQVPQSMKCTWDGAALIDGAAAPSTRVTGELVVPLGSPDQVNGLIDKVDILAEIPYVVRKVVNYVAGTKPYIYQTLNEVDLALCLPDALKDGSSEAGPLHVKGTLFEEHTFISE